jgi:hypothetical protein
LRAPAKKHTARAVPRHGATSGATEQKWLKGKQGKGSGLGEKRRINGGASVFRRRAAEFLPPGLPLSSGGAFGAF